MPAPDDVEATTHAVPAFSPTKLLSGKYALRVVAGPDLGQAFEIHATQPSASLLGQSPACTLRLTDATVSRRHVALDIVGDRLRVTDQGSKNGSFVNGVQVSEAFLVGGETLRVGQSEISVERVHSATDATLGPAKSFGKLLGASTEMRRLYPLCEKISAADVHVLIEGETGTGKEVLAEELHNHSPRRGKPFVVFDCTAAAPSVIESELFGHKRGAFTGAIEAHKGVFERANGGTLLLDEIGDLELGLQSKLLRAIERQEVRPVGGTDWIRVDVRILAATRRDLDREVAAGRFRDDLFHRLVVARIELPALRRRRGDILFLAGHFRAELGASGTFPLELLRRWEDYHWPGNVRELRNAAARYLLLGLDSPRLTSDSLESDSGSVENEELAVVPRHGGADLATDFNALVESILAKQLPLAQSRDELVASFLRVYVDRVLRYCGGNVGRAAAEAGIGRRYLQQLRSRLL